MPSACPVCPNVYPDGKNGGIQLRKHINAAHKNSTIEAINAGLQAGERPWSRCLKCTNHFTNWGPGIANHVLRCINYTDLALRREFKYKDFFPNHDFKDQTKANAYVIERAVGNIPPGNLPVGPNGNLQINAPLLAPPAVAIAPVVAANPIEVQPEADAEVLDEDDAPNPVAQPPNAQPRARGRNAPRNAAAPVQAAPAANVGNAGGIIPAAAPAMQGFGFEFVDEPSAAQLTELDHLVSELSEGCHWMHPTHVKNFRLITDTLIRAHLNPAGPVFIKQLAMYALLLLPGLFVRLQRIKTELPGNVLRDWNLSDNPVIAVLCRARQTLLLYPRRPSRGTAAKLTSTKVEELVKAQRLGSLMNAIESEADNIQMTSKSQAELSDLARTFHPVGNANDLIDDIHPPEGTAVANFDLVELATAITKLPMGSAAGASGWTFHLLRLLYEGEAVRIKNGELAVEMSGVGLLNRLFSTITMGTMDDFALRKLNTSRLLFVPKSNGGNRPIAIGDSLLRLYLRVLNAKYATDVGARLEPLQVAVGTSGGCEVMASLAQQSYSNNNYTLALDLHSAFNEVWRRAIAAGLQTYAPGLLPIFKRLYGRPSELRSNAKEGRAMLVGQSMRGCKQGDPLSMLYFSVAIHSWLRSVNALVIARHADLAPNTTPFTIGYADDIALGGDPDILCSCMPVISDSLVNTTGLQVTTRKCKLFGAAPFVQPADLPPIPASNQGSILVGVPIGSETFQEESCAIILQKAALGASRVRNASVTTAQVKFALLSKCVNARPQYLTRNVHPDIIAGSLLHFDNAIDQSLESILGAQLGPHRATLRGLPITHAGCGVRRHLGAESIQAFNSRNSLVKGFLQKFNNATAPAMQHAFDAVSVLEPIPFSQHDANHPVTSLKEVHLYLFKMALTNIEQESDGQEKSAFLKSGLHIGAADNTYSASGKFYLWSGGADRRWHMGDNIFVSATRRRLCLPETNFELMCPHSDQHRPPGSQVNLATHFGHLLLCRQGTPQAITNRHDYITQSLYDLIHKCLPGPVPVHVVTKEVEVGVRPNGTAIKADIVFLQNHDQPNQIKNVFDVTIVEPNNRHGYGRPEAGVAVEKAATDKVIDYAPVSMQANTVFIPFAIDSNGHFGKHATEYLNRLKQGSPGAGSRIRHFLQEVSYHLAKQTAIAAEAGRAAAYQMVWNHHPH